MPFLLPNQQHQSTEGTYTHMCAYTGLIRWKLLGQRYQRNIRRAYNHGDFRLNDITAGPYWTTLSSCVCQCTWRCTDVRWMWVIQRLSVTLLPAPSELHWVCCVCQCTLRRTDVRWTSVIQRLCGQFCSIMASHVLQTYTMSVTVHSTFLLL